MAHVRWLPELALADARFTAGIIYHILQHRHGMDAADWWRIVNSAQTRVGAVAIIAADVSAVIVCVDDPPANDDDADADALDLVAAATTDARRHRLDVPTELQYSLLNKDDLLRLVMLRDATVRSHEFLIPVA